MDLVENLRAKYKALAPALDERTTRLWAAAEALSLGRGGVKAVTEATGIRHKRIVAGKRELAALQDAEMVPEAPRRLRAPGAGRKKVTEREPALLAALDALVEPTTRGDPESPLRWTCKSTYQLAAALTAKGYAVSPSSVSRLLHELGYSLQANSKTREGNQHPERDVQFRYISKQVKVFQRAGQPVISVDTKKKELVGDFKNGGREWQPSGEPVAVRVHDFIDRQLGKAIPYGVYDVSRNEGWVNVGVDHDTAEFAVESIRRWWRHMGKKAYPDARELLITADAGGSNSPRTRLWKVELQRLADDTGLRISVCHFPPGTSKWNKIEHRLFCHITQNWRGRPLETVETVVNLIANTTTAAALKVRAALDKGRYPGGIKVTDQQLAEVAIKGKPTRPTWNYVVTPRTSQTSDQLF